MLATPAVLAAAMLAPTVLAATAMLAATVMLTTTVLTAPVMLTAPVLAAAMMLTPTVVLIAAVMFVCAAVVIRRSAVVICARSVVVVCAWRMAVIAADLTVLVLQLLPAVLVEPRLAAGLLLGARALSGFKARLARAALGLLTRTVVASRVMVSAAGAGARPLRALAFGAALLRPVRDHGADMLGLRAQALGAGEAADLAWMRPRARSTVRTLAVSARPRKGVRRTFLRLFL